MNRSRRQQGTGSVCCIHGRWYAYGPEHKNRKPFVGRGLSKGEAIKKLDAWLGAQRAGNTAPS